jgi:hypothetical protein|uniref:Uncharacterized protein n=1 Tax=viral metagenome TaxID=1070528 RepID=A0A6C0IXG2_9ZZZZ
MLRRAVYRNTVIIGSLSQHELLNLYKVKIPEKDRLVNVERQQYLLAKLTGKRAFTKLKHRQLFRFLPSPFFVAAFFPCECFENALSSSILTVWINWICCGLYDFDVDIYFRNLHTMKVQLGKLYDEKQPI